MRNIDLPDPDDHQAKEWYRNYGQWRKANKKLSGYPLRVYAWRYEPGTWLMAFIAFVVLYGGADNLPWWGRLSLYIVAGIYWPVAYFRQPRIERIYDRYIRKHRILRIPRFLYESASRQAKRYPGLTDWYEWPTRRYQLLRDIRLEEAALLAESWNDCGCEKLCGHTNRLATRIRKEARRRLRDKVNAKLRDIAAAHQGALEANKLRNDTVQRIAEGDQPPRLPRQRGSED